MARADRAALKAIDHTSESKYQAKQEQDCQPGEAVADLFSRQRLSRASNAQDRFEAYAMHPAA